MKRALLLVVASVFATSTVAFPSSAWAQNREGGWFGVGGGFGTANVTCDDCGESDRESSGAGYLRGGGALNPRVLLGGEFNIWTKTFAFEPGLDSTVNLYNFSGTVSFYPSVDRGFFVKGGAGVAFADIDLKETGGSTITVDVGNGPGLIVGAGYDISLGRRVALTPAVNVWYGSLGDMKFQGEPLLSGLKHNVFDITIGVTFP